MQGKSGMIFIFSCVFLCHSKEERNIRHVMKPTPPEPGHRGKLPSNKIEVGKKTTSFFYSKPISFIVNFGYFVVLKVMWCSWRNFVLVDTFRFYYLVHFPGQYTHTQRQNQKTLSVTWWGSPKDQRLPLFPIVSFVESVHAMTLQILLLHNE